MKRSPRPLPAWLLLFILITLLAPLQALASINTGAIKGITVDTDEGPVPGVLLTIRSTALIGGAQQRYSDQEGRFAFFELPPGDYALMAEKAGFSKSSHPNLRVDVGRTASITVVLRLKEAGEEIFVEESRPTIDTEQTSKGEVLSKEFLQRVPIGRSYQDAVSKVPGVVGGGNPSVSGGGSEENTYMLDGVNITDPVTGTFSLNFNFDAIEQLEVLTNALDPEYGEGLGGVINIVTESGSNTLHFDTSVWYGTSNWSPRMDARLSADGVELAPTGFDSQFSYVDVNAKVSGPIVRDRAWFIVSYSYNRSLYSNVGIDLPRDFDGHYVLAKFTFQPNAAHRFTLLTQTDPTTIDNLDQSDRFTKPEAQPRQAQTNIVTSAQWDWFFSPETFLETKATMQRQSVEYYGVPCTHNRDLGYNPCDPGEAENTVDLITPARIGSYNAFSSGNYPYYHFDNRVRYNASSKFSLLQVEALGMHDIKTGIDFDHTSWELTEGYTGNLYFFDLNSVSYAPDTYENYYWVETSGPARLQATGDHVGYFLQDAYKPVKNLTIRYGFRYDDTTQRNDMGEPVVDVGLWGPRVFAAWDPWGDNKTVFRGGYGRVNDTGRLSVASFNSKSRAFGYKLYLGEYLDGWSNASTDNYTEEKDESKNVVWNEMVAPHADEFVIGGQREIIQDMAIGVSFMARFTRNIYEYDDVNVMWDDDGYNWLGTTNGIAEYIFRLRTPDLARRDFYQTDVQLKKNYSDRWQVLATYSYIHSMGTTQEAISGTLLNPEETELAYGNLWSDMRHQVKASATYDLPFDPWTTQLGLSFEFYSGVPVTRYYYSEAYSSYGFLQDNVGTYARSQPIWSLDFMGQQAIPVRKGQLWAIVQVFNVFNTQQADGYSGGWVASYNRWVITSRQNPRTLNLGVRYKF